MLEQVLDNALVAIRDKGLDADEGEIRIKTSGEGNDATVTIIDNGVGMSAESREHMFEPFSGTHADRPGVGLAITQHIAHKYGGRIAVGSHEGGGTVLRVSLPGDVRMRPGKGRRPILSLLLAPVILGCALVAYFALEGAGDLPAVAAEPAMDCGDGSQVDHAAFLFDLRKPLDAVHATLPSALFRQAAHAMDAGTELAVYTLSPHAEAPRTLIGRLCKTFDDAGLTAESSKHLATDDCDIPAQVPAALRASAKDFCRRRDALARRIDALVVETFGQAAGAAYLVEALEATARDFGETAGSLHVFSDLVQHAAWFSHAESPLEEWEFERMASAWTALPLEEALRGFPPETSVRIHYVPRTGTTELEEWRATPQALLASLLRRHGPPIR